MYICIYVYMYICIYVYMYICIYVYMYICIYVYMYICIYVYMYICIRICICLWLCIYIYVYNMSTMTTLGNSQLGMGQSLGSLARDLHGSDFRCFVFPASLRMETCTTMRRIGTRVIPCPSKRRIRVRGAQKAGFWGFGYTILWEYPLSSNMASWEIPDQNGFFNGKIHGVEREFPLLRQARLSQR